MFVVGWRFGRRLNEVVVLVHGKETSAIRITDGDDFVERMLEYAVSGSLLDYVRDWLR
jgi:hypothetical protein